jgi:UDP-sulfoquinovose synthase
MRILLLGADGYLGWPLALELTKKNCEVFAVDNGFKRDMCASLKINPLICIKDFLTRSSVLQATCKASFQALDVDLSNWENVNTLFLEYGPFDTVYQLAEQPSAPFSMISGSTSLKTLSNNVSITNNVLFAMATHCPDAHLIHIGTMGEYGTPNIDIEEGWLDIKHKGKSDRFLFPRQAGSVYHTSKIMTTDLIWFAVRNWGLSATELMQGPVYGLLSDLDDKNDVGQNHYYYDEIFGTVLNRFVAQAVANHPLTVYGKGEQKRGFINIIDSIQCLMLAMQQPAERGQLRIFNQITETFSVMQLAQKVQRAARAFDFRVRIERTENPRVESEDHYYNPKYSDLKKLGLVPTPLTDNALSQMFNSIMRHRSSIDVSKFRMRVSWK